MSDRWRGLLDAVIPPADTLGILTPREAPLPLAAADDRHRRRFLADRFAMGVMSVLADQLAARGVTWPQ